MADPTERDPLSEHPGWRWCTAEGAREDILRRGMESTLREKLEWLEEAETLSLRLRASEEGQRPDLKPVQAGANKATAGPEHRFHDTKNANGAQESSIVSTRG